MAKGYLIAEMTVTDPEAYVDYAKAAGDLLTAYGARTIVKPDTAIIKEGTPKARIVIFEFDSFEKTQAVWDSPEYQKAISLRIGAAEGDFILIEGND